MYVKKNHVQNTATCSCENGKYLGSIMNDSEITCDEIIEPCEEDADAEAKSNEEAKSDRETKTISTNFNKKSNL